MHVSGVTARSSREIWSTDSHCFSTVEPGLVLDAAWGAASSRPRIWLLLPVRITRRAWIVLTSAILAVSVVRCNSPTEPAGVPIAVGSERFVTLSAGGDRSCGITASGATYCLG